MPPDPPLPAALVTAAIPPPAGIATHPYHVGDAILPGYRLTALLGRGGFGEVWRAEAPGGMGVAIKVLANLGRREGSREYRALQTIKNIRHAHIVPLFGVWLKTSAGRVLEEAEVAVAEQRILAPRADAAAPADLEALELVVAMGLGDQTLSDRLKEAVAAGLGAVPVGELLAWMHQTALALDHFNGGRRRGEEAGRPVQHCDIKPQNILLVGEVVQVCDFGLARVQGDVRATSNTMASLAYAAPELVTPPYDPAATTDQYSLAITYLELRSGRLPYADLSPVTIMRAKTEGRLVLGDLPAAEAAVLTRGLEVDPARRWPTNAAFAGALAAAVEEDGTAGPSIAGAAAAGAGGSHPAAPRWRRWLPGTVAALCAGLVLGAVALRGLPTGSRQRADVDQRAVDQRAVDLWNRQEAHAAAGRRAECLPLLEQLSALYATEPRPMVETLSQGDVLTNLAWYRATLPGTSPAAAAEAVTLAQQALDRAADEGIDDRGLAGRLDTLAAALARAGRWEEALATSGRALAATTDPPSRAEFTRHRETFARHEPWIEP